MKSTRERLARLSGSKDSLYALEREVLGEVASSLGEALSVKERLERLVAAHLTSRAERKRPEDVPPGKRRAVSIEEIIEGRSLENEHGRYYAVETAYPLDHWHGRSSLSRLKAVSRSAFAVLAGRDEGLGVDLTRTVFLDCETTGLQGGAGTCPFLVGLAYVEDDHFVVKQLFMRDYPEETALLAALSELLSRFESLVTFNGKSFDVPLLESRFVLSRLRFPLSDVPHFDLLHPARSLWKARLESCRLVELEYALLAFERDDDVPGELIPGLYFDYVRNGDATRIRNVFVHNRHDLLSLAALTIHASELIDEGITPEDPVDDYSLGRVFGRADAVERSMKHYTRALDAGVGGAARRRSLQNLALHYKKRGEWERAVELWTELGGEEGPEAMDALRELAMYREHRARDLGGALDVCDEALSRAERDVRLPLAVRERLVKELGARRLRLKRRVAGGLQRVLSARDEP